MPFIDPSWRPDEDKVTLQYERNFVAGDVISGIGFGIQFVLYVACMRDLWTRRSNAKASIFLMAYITLLISIELILLGVQANTIQIMYIDHRNYPGGPWNFFLATQNWTVNIIYYATVFVSTFLSDILVLWRCWVIWSAAGNVIAYLVTAFPALLILTSFAIGTIWTLQSSQPGLSMYSKNPLAWGTAYYSLSLGVNIILTCLIVSRLLIYRRRILKTLPPEHAKHYTGIVTIIVESAALYSVFALCFLVAYALNDPMNQIFLGIASSCQQIAGYFIIYRLATGRAWKKNTLKPKSIMTSMHFTRPDRGDAVTLTTMHANPNPELSIESSVSIPMEERKGKLEMGLGSSSQTLGEKRLD